MTVSQNEDPASFELTVRPSPAVRFLRAGVIGLGALGFALAGWLSRGHDERWLLLAFGALMLWAGWRHSGLGLAWGTLRVNADGRPQWRAEGASPTGGFAPVSVERWHAGEQLAWLRLRGADGRRHEILIGRTGLNDENWRELASWLAWLRRGRHSAG